MPTGAPTIATVEPRLTAVIAQTTTWQEFPKLWSQLLDEVYTFVRSCDEFAGEDGSSPRWQNVMLYNNDEPSVEVGVLAPSPFKPGGRVIASRLPGGEVAMAVHRGDYAQLGTTHDAVNEYVAAHGLQLAGPRWEIYGHWREDPRELETEIYYLLRSSPRGAGASLTAPDG
jgi:effector-binding domain-containing protein